MTGREIAETRAALGLSIIELAGILGVAFQTVYRWEAALATKRVSGTCLLVMQAMRDAVKNTTISKRTILAAKARMGVKALVFDSIMTRM